MAILGQDCDILLFHGAVDGGAPQGFLLDRSRLSLGNISVHRSAYKQADGSFVDQQLVAFTLLLGAKLVRPDGTSLEEDTVSQYNRLFDLLQQRSEVGVITPEGVFSGLYSAGNYAIEERSGGVMRITIQLNSDGNIFAPANRERFEQSLWVDEGTYSGSMTWENSYWRSA